MTDIKTLLVPFGGRADELPALKIALNLAGDFAAHVEVLHVSPDPVALAATAYAGMGGAAPILDSFTKDVEKRNKAAQKAAKKEYQQMVESHHIRHDEAVVAPKYASASFHTAVGNAADIIAIKGRLADLIVMSRAIKDINVDYETAVVSALFDTGRPVLFTPPGQIPNNIGGSIVIAWNGSTQAIRAVACALPLLRRVAKGAKVWVLTEKTGAGRNIPITPQALCLYLKYHGIEAEALLADSKGLAAGAAILSEAHRLKVGLIVMGAFSHSRLREMILGGVTDFMLGNAEIPLLMAH